MSRNNQISRIIKAARKQKKWSQSDLAAAADVSRSYIQNIENPCNRSFIRLQKILDKLNLKLIEYAPDSSTTDSNGD